MRDLALSPISFSTQFVIKDTKLTGRQTLCCQHFTEQCPAVLCVGNTAKYARITAEKTPKKFVYYFPRVIELGIRP